MNPNHQMMSGHRKLITKCVGSCSGAATLTTQAAAELRRSQVKMTDLSQIKILWPDLKKAFDKSSSEKENNA